MCASVGFEAKEIESGRANEWESIVKRSETNYKQIIVLFSDVVPNASSI